MQYEFEIREVVERKALVARATTEQSQLGATIGKLFGMITPVMKDHGLEMDGPPFCKYLAWRESDCDIEAGAWVHGDCPKDGDVFESSTSGGRVLVTRHVGPYDKLHDGYAACMEYGKVNGLKLDAPWEVYITDPGREPDTSKWITDIYFPII